MTLDLPPARNPAVEAECKEKIRDTVCEKGKSAKKSVRSLANIPLHQQNLSSQETSRPRHHFAVTRHYGATKYAATKSY